jgi:hypothetical protein
MAPEGEWILLSTAVVRMGTLHPNYFTWPGHARGDLEKVIRAGLAIIRGRRAGYLHKPPILIKEPVTATDRLDLVHNTFVKQARGLRDSGTLFRDVEIRWASVVPHLRSMTEARWGYKVTIAPTHSIAIPAETIVSGPKKTRQRTARSRAEQAISALYPNGVPEQAELPNVLLYRAVNEWLKGKQLPDVKNDSILRAAGRRGK